MQRTLISLIFGVVLAIVAVGLLTVYIRGLRGVGLEGAQSAATVQIVVAKKDLVFGTEVTPPMLEEMQWPKASAPKNAFHSIDEIFRNADGKERIALGTVVAGAPVLQSLISGFGARPTLSREVKPGMRAVAIRVNDVSGVGGFILPGDHVDVLLTRRLPGSEPDNFATNTIIQDVVILGIDQLSNQQHDKPVVGHSATIEVTPEQAQTLALAEQAGTLSLALRNVATTGKVATNQMVTRDLAGGVPEVKQRRHVSSEPAIRIIYGGGK